MAHTGSLPIGHCAKVTASQRPRARPRSLRGRRGDSVRTSAFAPYSFLVPQLEMLNLLEYWESQRGNEPAMTNKIFMHLLSSFHLASPWGWPPLPAPPGVLGACLEAAVSGSPGGELTARLSSPEPPLVFLIAWVCPDSVPWNQLVSPVSDPDGVASATPGLRLLPGRPLEVTRMLRALEPPT